MSWLACPICSTQNAKERIRCSSCGADFSDPDVVALIEGGGSQLEPPSDIEAGALNSSKLLGVEEDALMDGRAATRLAIAGALLLLGAFLLPLHEDFHTSLMAWEATHLVPSNALFFAPLAAIVGLASAFAPLEPWQKNITLGLTGLVGLILVPLVGPLSGSPSNLAPFLCLGLVVSISGLAWRARKVHSQGARKLAIAGAALVILSYFIPTAASEQALPVELRFYLSGDLGSGSPLSAYTTVFNRDPLVFFSVVYLLLPLVLLPLAAILAWPTPTGPWDKTGKLLNPLLWFLVLYIPIGYALFAFNLFGDDIGRVYIDGHFHSWQDFSSAALRGRARQLLLALPFALWAGAPAAGAVRQLREKFSYRQPPAPPL